MWILTAAAMKLRVTDSYSLGVRLRSPRCRGDGGA
jgi:hypothetical protein